MTGELTVYWSSVETLFFSSLQCRCGRRQWLLGLVVVSSMFAVDSFHPVCSVLRQLCAPAESTLMYRAFPLFLRQHVPIIRSTCCPTCVDKDSHPRCVVLVFLLVLHLRAAMVARGLAGSAKRLKRRSRRAKDHSASSARGSRERRSGSTEWCSVRNRLRDHRASCL